MFFTSVRCKTYPTLYYILNLPKQQFYQRNLFLFFIMCSQFKLHGMENYQGDLADIVRGSGLAGNAAQEAEPPALPDTWQYSGGDNDNIAAAVMNCYSDHRDFGDPFSHMRDPLMFQDLAMPPPPPSAAFFACSDNDLADTAAAAAVSETAASSAVFAPPKLILDEEMKRPACNIFSRMLQISPTSNPPPPAGGGGIACGENIISAASSSGNAAAGLQISSPRNTGSIKRRKSQAKKVVCVPAPAPANSRPSGEVVPSDLWAWRKYGQKPIKGSPYPRGYYRCSSSKGCSARKQVERSRTDPNMLVITYTSEHNHPWPTQRNALAGSTRSQAAKNAAAKSSLSQTPTPNDTQTDPHDTPPVKEETTTAPEDRAIQINDLDEFPAAAGGFPQSYKPALPSSDDPHHHPEDFFADLGEIESTDPLNLMFSQAFPSGQEKKAAGIAIDDAFNFYDWTDSNNNNNNNSIQTLGKSDSGQRGL
nr:probable WRKY transcription factor 14 [Ipomoea batatas]